MARVAGMDEAGRGAWAGPVAAAAVILPCDPGILTVLDGVRDSKCLTPHQRDVQLAHIAAAALALAIDYASAAEIDALGIVPATRLAMQRALAALSPGPEALIIDALRLPQVRLPQESFPFADVRSLSVAAAGIVAKVHRDRWMIEEGDVGFPGYGFAQHKGYGTRQHHDALQALGPCTIHRRTFRPVATRLAGGDG
ncbi:MAG: ribonuclease HII [Anaerolineae bacterium]|nr:ribonuclease HII [Anaerolineae bacterium]